MREAIAVGLTAAFAGGTLYVIWQYARWKRDGR